jgi:hypothetical protein
MMNYNSASFKRYGTGRYDKGFNKFELWLSS